MTHLYERPDTRYAGGVAMWYANHLVAAIGGDASDYIAACEDFVDSTVEWHESHRHEFKPKPDWQRSVLNAMLRRAAERAWTLGFGLATHPEHEKGAHISAAIEHAYGRTGWAPA